MKPCIMKMSIVQLQNLKKKNEKARGKGRIGKRKCAKFMKRP